MPVNPKKLIEAIKLECEKIPERVEGYHEELLLTVADILTAEREHTIRRSQIQQQVNEFCDRLGKYLEVKMTPFDT